MTDRSYGDPPEVMAVFDLDFAEYMHFMYLPIRIGSEAPWDLRVPRRLMFARDLILHATYVEWKRGHAWQYVYLTARRGFATPGNPLNRPGWHADGFGTDDVNYVWTDRYPTQFALQRFTGVSDDHVESLRAFEDQIIPDRIRTYPNRTLLRLDPFVIHAAPEIPPPGGERLFLKVSFSNDRYDLIGNSHNYLFDYEWPMHSRAEVRNDPARAAGDRAVA